MKKAIERSYSDLMDHRYRELLMGRDLVDISAIAERLDVPKDTVNKWRFRGLLPEPDYPLAVGPVWEWSTIEKWAKKTGRL